MCASEAVDARARLISFGVRVRRSMDPVAYAARCDPLMQRVRPTPASLGVRQGWSTPRPLTSRRYEMMALPKGSRLAAIHFPQVRLGF